jgi:hypothetical protein
MTTATDHAIQRRRYVLRVDSKIDAQVNFWNDPAKFRAFVGGVGSGKTTAGAIELLRQPPNRTGLVVAPTYPILRDATLRTFLELCPVDLIQEHNRSENRIELRNGSTLLFRSSDRPDGLRGPNINYAWLDEGAYISEEAYKVIVGRLRRWPGRLWLTTTPRGHNYVYRRFVKSPSSAHSLHTSATAKNPYLPSDFVDTLREEYGDSAYALQELDGRFVDTSGDKRIDPTLIASVYSSASTLKLWEIKDSPLPSTARIYKAPVAGREYCLGVDVAEGVPGGDDSAVVVVERETGRLVAVVAGEYEPTVDLSEIINTTSSWYNDAPALIERNNHGHATIAACKGRTVLLSGSDGRPGYLTTRPSKSELYRCTQRALLDARQQGLRILYDLRLKEQLASIERTTLKAPEKGKKTKVDDEATAYVLAQKARTGATVQKARSAMLQMFGGR